MSREAVLKLIYDYKELHIENREEHPINYGTLCDMIRWVRELPSVLPKADKPIIIDWNNCHTSEQLDSIATTKNDLAVEKTDMIDKSNFSQEQYKTDLQSAYDCGYEQAKNDLGVDCISRIETIDYLCKHCPDDGECFKDCDEIKHLRQMPSVTPQEPKTGHWIANAPQYDMLNPQYICSECGNAHTRTTPYCEMCGAKMFEPQESEE